MTPYRATILGQEATVSGWLDDRTLVLSDGRRFAFAPPPPAGSRTRRLLAVAVLRATRAGWLIDGRPLEELGRAAVRTGPITGREFGLHILWSKTNNLSREDAEATNAVAWFADSSLEDGEEDQGWTNPVLLREVCEMAPTLEPAEALNEAARQRELKEIKEQQQATNAKLASVDTKADQIGSDVRGLLGKKRYQERAFRSKGGEATFKLAAYPDEAREMRKIMRRARDSWVKAHGKRGARQKAIYVGRNWWKSKFKDVAMESALDKVSDNSLANLMDGKTGAVLRRKSKR